MSNYDQFRNSPYWVVLDNAINDLLENQDIIENTSRDRIVGYLIKSIEYAKKTGTIDNCVRLFERRSLFG